MTTRTAQRPLPLTQLRRRFVHGWRTLFTPGDISTLTIAAILLLMPVLALETSGWPLSSRTILPLLGLSIAFGFLLARSHYNELLSLLMSGIYGTGFALLIAAINEPGSIAEGVYSVLTRLLQWLVDAATGGINQDNLVFTILVAMLFWFLGYNLTWHIFRVDRILRAILPPSLILVTNSVYYTGDQNLEGFLIVFMFMSLLLIVRSNLDARTWDWYIQGIRVPGKLRRQFFRMGAALALLALLIGWVIPSSDLQERLNRFQEFLQSEPLTQLGEIWNRLFSTVETQGPTTTDYYGGDSLQLGGAIRLGEQVVLVIAAPPGRRYYWRSRVFDTYENGRWTPAADTRLSDDQSPLEILTEPYLTGARDPVQQHFTVALNATRLIYTAPQPARVELPTRTDLRYTSEARDVMNISVIRPFHVLHRGDSYTATSLMSSATAGQLRAAGTEYPPYVRNLYFYVSPSVTDRTIQLARDIVNESGTTNPYDQARAIETWLRTNIEYNEAIPQPPHGHDPVDWVLFDVRQGYCNYYASAMIMMLRSLGIPARMAAGFAQGAWDPAQQAFVVQERDAHTWVEVYFPGYGWIEFEPTAAQAPLNRLDEAPAGPQPSATPLATPTPTVTPTPTATPTPDPLTPLAEQAQALPTVTPTFTPSPTATPVIVPTQPPPLTPQPRSPLAFLLSALGVAFLGLLFIVLLAGVGVITWWWWEWRGMGGLSPVARAYARLERYIGLIGIRPGTQQTPEERRRQIVRQLPGAEPPVTAITRMYTVERYGPGPRRLQEVATHADVAEEAWVDARGSILRRFLRRLLPWQR